MREFFGTPTKVVLLLIFAAGVTVSFTSGKPAVAEERKVLMGLSSGAVEFFKEVVPSIVQVYNGGIQAGTMAGGGSGYVIDREGHFITNKHVTDNAPVVEVAFYGDETNTRGYAEGRWKGTVIAEDAPLDLAVVKVDAPPEKFHPVRLGDSSIVRPGDPVATFGSPGGDPGWVDRSWIAIHDSWLEFYNLNLGVISEVLNFEEAFWTYYSNFAQNPSDYYARVGTRDYGTAVQYLFHTDSAINHGNSGGPCLNMYGEAIGTNTWGFGRENLAFSVPVNLLKRSVADIIQYGRVRRPWFGIALHPTRAPMGELQYQWDIGAYDKPIGVWFDSTPEEMKIYTVNPYSPAYQAGLREGDIIVRIDGKKYENIFDVYAYFLNAEVGQEVLVEYVRGGHGQPPIKVKLAEKATRYFGREIQASGSGRWTFDVTRYTSDITY